MVFSATEPFILDSVSIYPQNAGNITFELRNMANNGNLLLAKRTVSVSAGGYVKQTVPLEWVIAEGSDYRLVIKNGTSGQIGYNSSVSGTVFPFTLGGVAHVVSSFENKTQTYTNWYGIYDWTIRKSYCFSTPDTIVAPVVFPDILPDSVWSCQDTLLRASSHLTASYLWSNGQQLSAISVADSGTYRVTMTDISTGCSATDSVVVYRPVARIMQPDGTLCGDQLTVNYTADTSARVIWSGVAGVDTIPVLPVNTPGLYTVTVLTKEGCILTDTAIYTGIEPFPVVNLPEATSACGTVVLNAGNPGATYYWTPNGTTTQQNTITQTGIYTVSVTNIAGCTTHDTTLVTVFKNPEADFEYVAGW